MNNALKMRHTGVFTKNYKAFHDDNIRFIINQGGSRSSKTYSICQLILWYALTHKNKRISVARKTGPALFASVYRDFISILQELEIYDYIKHNKSAGSFSFPNGCTVQFFSIDDQQKLRGRKHDFVFLNEANEITREEFTQINMRTSGKIILDWNPSDPWSWVIELQKDPKAVLIHSTYKDNPFLEDEIVREIENLINTDETYYQIYALGIVPTGKENVFPTLHYTEFPEDLQFVYGADWGFNDPTTIMKVAQKDGKLYIKEELYESYLTPEDIIERMNALGIRKDIEIVADHRPDIIQSLNNAGWYVTKAKKNIKEGLALMKQNEIHIDPSSHNAIREFRGHLWRKYKDRILDEPVDFNNHAIDAARYATMKLSQGFGISVMV
jgi:phage terminase large subunit